MEIWLKSEEGSIRLPVLPPEFNLQTGASISSAGIVKAGEFDIYNGQTLRTASLQSFFPRYYTSYVDYQDIQDPYSYCETLEDWCKRGVLVRYIVTDTNINLEMRITNFEYREQDGTRDVYFNLDLTEHRRLIFTRSSVEKADASKKPPSKRPSKPTESKKKRFYTVKKGDCLWSIARKYYGNGAEYRRIYNANRDKIKNPSLIYPNQKLVIP